MSVVNLNLARKWRSKNFDQLIGQDLPIRMLKNSLYLDQFFPVYLFSGQRGCGKTSTARVFASAINCDHLANFQKSPKSSSVPCLSCLSCKAMLAGNHPDFFELDAASHTGVDNIRQIIESCTLMPQMSRKKIYLIDEAHMLSKAAFNALLKILEEPPQSVLFILATTDPQKIIETVTSRCFQLFFKSLPADTVLQHLGAICKEEDIAYDTQGLELIVQETDGSVRDAINMLEQVRFSSTDGVDKDAVLQVLGHIDDARLIDLFDCIIRGKSGKLLTQLNDLKFESCSPEFIWKRMAQLVRCLLWLKHEVTPKQFALHHDLLRDYAQRCSRTMLHDMLDMFCSQESTFSRTTSKHLFLEMLLLQICNRYDDSSDNMSGVPSAPANPEVVEETISDDEDDEELENDEEEEEEGGEAAQEVPNTDDGTALWCKFVQHIESLDDPLLSSVIKQGKFIAWDSTAARVEVEFSKDLVFFKDWFDSSKNSWQPVLHKLFDERAAFCPLFTGAVKAAVPKPVESVAVAEAAETAPVGSKSTAARPAQQLQAQRRNFQQRPNNGQQRYGQRSMPQLREPRLDVSDEQQWQKVHMLMRYFPGTVTEVREG